MIFSIVSELILAAAVIGVAALLFPYLKRQHEGVAVGYVAVRIIEDSLEKATSEQSWFKAMSRWLRAVVWSTFNRKRLVALIPTKIQQDLLLAVTDSIETGNVVPIVTAIYPLNEAPVAIERLEEGHGRGQVVIEFSA